MKFGIDLGHGVKFDGGAIGIKREEECIDPVGIKVIQKLKALGHTVVELRPATATSLDNSLTQRWQKANANNVDMVTSIHFNKTLGGKGAEVYALSAESKVIAERVLNEIVKLGYRNRGVKSANYAMLRRTNAPAILVECAFLDSEEDMNRYNAEDIANAIILGLTGQVVQEKPKRYYIVTNYITPEKYGIEFNTLKEKYFSELERIYVKNNDKGVWIETQYLNKETAEALVEKLKKDNLFWKLVEE